VKLPVVEIYTSVGYSSGKSNIDFKGNYTSTYSYKTGYPPPNDNATETVTVTDPVTLNYTGNGLSNTWGLRLNLAIFKIYADYTFAKYSGLGAGIAFSFR
jgi:hypothetical protein